MKNTLTNKVLHGGILAALMLQGALSSAQTTPFDLWWVGGGSLVLGDTMKFSETAQQGTTDYYTGSFEYADLKLDARYTDNGQNFFKLIGGDVTVNSITITDTWNDVAGGNKTRAWIGGIDGADRATTPIHTLQINGDWTFNSGMGDTWVYKATHLIAEKLVFDISSINRDNADNRSVDLGVFSSITVDRIDINQAHVINISGAWYNDAGIIKGGITVNGIYNGATGRNEAFNLSNFNTAYFNDAPNANINGDINISNFTGAVEFVRVGRDPTQSGGSAQDIIGSVDIAGNIIAKNEADAFGGTINFTDSGNVNVGDITTENVAYLTMAYVGTQNNVAIGTNGINTGNINITKMGDFTYKGSSYLKVNGDFDATDLSWFVGHSSHGKTGYLDVTGNFSAHNLFQMQTFGSDYVRIGGNLTLTKDDSSDAWAEVNSNDVQTFTVGGNADIYGGFFFQRGQLLDVGGYFKAGGHVQIFDAGAMKVGGDLIMTNTTYFDSGFKNGIDGAAASVNNANLHVDGRIIMTTRTNPDAHGTDANYKVSWSAGISDQYVYSRGLQGDGKIVLSRSAGTDVVSQTFIFNNQKSDGVSNWIGGIYNEGFDGSAGQNILMNIIKKGDGEQVFSLTGGRWHGTLDVQAGTFRMRTVTGSGDYQVDVSINGGNWGAAEDGGYYDVKANDVAWNSGHIIMHIGQDDLLSYMDLNSLTLGSADSYVFLVDYDPLLELDGYSLKLEDFLYITGGLTEADVNKFSFKTSDGKYNGFFDGNWTGYWEDSTFVFVIPEPATVAAILGALALAFAAYRKRR